MKALSTNILFCAVSLILLYGCGGNDDAPASESQTLTGEYKLVSMVSDKTVDLNNDGLPSNNLLEETDPLFFSGTTPDLEIESALFDNKMVPLMSFYLPHPKLSLDAQGKAHVGYSRRGVGYEYAFNYQTREVVIEKEDENENPDTLNSGRLEEVQLIGTNTLEAVFKKYYYDFEVGGWQELTITCIYIRI